MITIKHNNKDVDLKEIAKIFDVSYNVIYAMYSKGHNTFELMVKYRKDVKVNKFQKGGHPIKIHNTSRGLLSLQQCVFCHPHKLRMITIRTRAELWGWDHKCLWFGKMSTKKSREEAIELDGPPRGKAIPYKTSVKKKMKKFDRGKTCYRYRGQERCVHYNKRLALDIGIPPECKIAEGDTCKNYEGETLDISNLNNCSGRSVRSFRRNGTYTEAR